MTRRVRCYIILQLRARSVAWFNTSPCHGEDRQFKSGRARCLKQILILVFARAVGAAIFSPAELNAAEPKPEYQLELKVQEVGRALVNNDNRALYRLFVPVFQQEVSFARFDSAVSRWRAGRQVVRVRSEVTGVRGLGGHASTYVFFQRERDYEYVYQNWIYGDAGWELTWLSNILDQSFQYGRSETVAMREVAETALAYFLSPEGRKKVGLERLVLPETMVVVQYDRIEEAPMEIAGMTIVWQTPQQIRSRRMFPNLPVCCEFGMVRVYGTVAIVALDFRAWPHYQGRPVLRRPRGLEFYLKKKGGVWEIHSTGKRWG